MASVNGVCVVPKSDILAEGSTTGTQDYETER